MILVISIVSESVAKLIVEEIRSSFDEKIEPYGVLVIKDVSNAYESGTKLTDD